MGRIEMDGERIMKEMKYRIGDVANLMGLSRDTLRHYEKCGILSSEKADNGYRYYTDQDVSRLLGILYQRKMDIGLTEIASLWNQENTVDQLSNILARRLDEEEQELRRHQQTIARLKLSMSDCDHVKKNLNQVFLRELPESYIIVPNSDFQSSMNLWFQYAREYSGLDMMYLLDEYSWEKNSDVLCIEYRNTQLTLHKNLAEYTDYPLQKQAAMEQTPTSCVSTFRVLNHRVPTAEDVLPMIEWAEQQGLMVSQRLYASFAFQGIQNGQQAYYMQLYIPVF